MLFSSCQCKKNMLADNPYGLPSATQNGAWTMGALLNGVPWTPKNSWIFAAIHGDSVVTLNGQTTNGASGVLIGISFFIDRDNFNTNVNRHLDSYNIINLSTDSTCQGILGSAGILDSKSSYGSITITRLDTIKNIVSGVFTSTVPINNCDTLKITYGRFDIPLAHQ